MKSINRFSQSGCRICGKMNGMYVNVLEKKSKRYLFQIRKFLQVEISSSDNFSKIICHNCIATLNDFAVLFEQCQVVQQELNESICHEDILRNRDVFTDEGDNSSHQNLNDVENDNHKPVIPNLIILNDQPHLSEVVEPTDEESSDPLLSEFDVAIAEEMNNEIQDNACDDLHEEENNTEKAHEESNSSVVANSDGDWKIQKLPNSDTKLYLCNKCSSILLCEGAKKSHKCHKTEDDLDISEDSPKKPKLESDC